MKLLVIDGNSILNRAFYGIRELSTKSGIPTNAVLGFLNILFKSIGETSPDGIVVAFDLPAPTFRHKMYDGYKATRKPSPDDLRIQFPMIKEIIKLLGYHVVEKEGFEADDILGSFAKSCEQSGDTCLIATGDRDSLQLVCDTVSVRLASTKETIIYTPEKINEIYGVSPCELIEVKALMGDSSDNIPGVKGVGEKTALNLVTQYKTLENLYANIDDEGIKPKVREKLLNDKELAFLSRDLGTINCDVPIDLTPENYKSLPPQRDLLIAKFVELEMNSMIRKIDTDAVVPENMVPTTSVTMNVIQNPSYEQAKEYCKDTVDFFPEFDGEELIALYVTTKDTVLVYSFNPHTAFEQVVLKSTLPKRTIGAKGVYKYLIKSGLLIDDLVMDLELAGYLLKPDAKSYDLAALKEEYLPQLNLTDKATNGECEPPAILTHIIDFIGREIESKELGTLLREIEIPFSEVLASMEVTGFSVDQSGVAEFGNQLTEKIATLTTEIHTLAEDDFNINSPQALGEILFNKLGLPAKKKTKTGYSTNADVLESLKNSHEIIPKILEYRKLTKLNSTYVVGLKKEIGIDGRIHSIFKQTEARTGRISSTEPNMQNIPVRTKLGREMRKFFVAKEGYTLVDADYSQIELRVLAHISGDENMIAAFNADADIHKITASQVFGVPIDDVSSEFRSRAKAINFGIVYGISAFGLSQDIGVTVPEASHYIKEYLATYSGVKGYMDDIIEQGKRFGFVSTLFARRRYLPELKSSNHNIRSFGERVALNAPIQGTAADILKIAMVKIYRRLKSENIDAKIILQVHDEIILETAEAEAIKALLILTQEMENAAKLSVPLKVDGHVGKTWYIAKGE